MKTLQSIAGALALAAIPLASCEKVEEDRTEAAGGEVHRTLASAIASAPELSVVSDALSDSGLAGVFDGPGSYTVLAPQDDAFRQLGDGEQSIASPEAKPVLVAVLRDHILPGHLTPAAIREAVAAQGGPVRMRTLGEGNVSFSLDGETIRVESDEGMRASVEGAALTASNGMVIPIDGLLKTPQPTARPDQ